MNQNNSLGNKIRDQRKTQQLTLVQLAESCQISPSFLSQIERDQATPSVTTLYSIADALKVPMASFFSEPEASPQPETPKKPQLRGQVVLNTMRKRLIYPETNIINELLTPDLQGAIQMMWIIMPPGTDSGIQPFSHEGEECGVILQGKIEARLGEEKFILGPGDSIYHSSEIPHSCKNIGETDVIMVVAKTPPAI